jgi:2-amino-4-hydroxy-6-hydroxymethyldihydropteridine diphosphokinase
VRKKDLTGLSGQKDQSLREAEMKMDLSSSTQNAELKRREKQMHKVFIGIGSNLGDKQKACLQAVEQIGRIPESRLLRCSGWYLSKPMGVAGQDWYVNGVVLIETALGSLELLRQLQQIEKEMGRIRKVHWEARLIDLDILFFDREILSAEDLEIPHPRVHERRFTLLPLLELNPDFVHPVSGLSVRELLEQLDPQEQEVILSRIM